MKFEEAKLPDHPDIRAAFAAVNAMYGDTGEGTNRPMLEGLWEARFLADNLADKDPVVIATALALPMRIDIRKTFFVNEVFKDLPQAVRQSLEDLTAGPYHSPADGLNGLAMLAYRVDVLQGKYALNLANRPKIPLEKLDAFDNVVEQMRGEWLEMVMEAKNGAPEITEPFKDSEPKLVAAFNAVLDNAVEVLAGPPKPASKTKTQGLKP